MLELDPIYALPDRMRVEVVDGIIQEKGDTPLARRDAGAHQRPNGNLPVDDAPGFVKGAIVNELHYMLNRKM